MASNQGTIEISQGNVILAETDEIFVQEEPFENELAYEEAFTTMPKTTDVAEENSYPAIPVNVDTEEYPDNSLESQTHDVDNDE